jgi:glycosyltransferase involved in cell wall biosynthesis
MFGDHKWKIYKSSDLFVLPTFSENFGLSVAESLSSGVPVVVTCGAPWSLVDTIGCGWSIDIGVIPLVDCLRAAMSKNQKELHEMGERGRVWMVKDFSWVTFSVKMKLTYKWLLDQSRDKPDWVEIN